MYRKGKKDIILDTTFEVCTGEEFIINHDYKHFFKQLHNDEKFEKMIRDITLRVLPNKE